MSLVVEENPEIKHYRCVKCNLVKRVKGAISPMIEVKCEDVSCKSDRFRFWNGETRKIKLLPTEKMVIMAMRGIVNV